MGFFLSNPIFLWGLAGSLIPLVLHLERRRSARTVPFTMLPFLRELERKRFLNLRILELLLLLLRMAIIALIAVALAGPTLTFSEGAPSWALLLTSRSEHRDTIILLDTSYSMDAAWLGDSAWEHASRILLATARRPRALPALSVYPFSDGLDRPAPTLPPVPLPPDLAKGLGQLRPIGQRTDVGKALVHLRNQVGSLEGREVVVVTDLQRNGWDSLLQRAVALPSSFRLTVVDACEQQPANLWLDGFEAPPLPWGYGQEEVIRFLVRNCGFEPDSSVAAEVLLHGENDEVLQKQPVSITPGVKLRMEWGVRALAAEVFRGRVRLQPAEAVEDALVTDNQTEFEIPVLSGQRALIVGGTESLTRAALSLGFSPSVATSQGEFFLRLSQVESVSVLPPDLGEYSFVVLVMAPGEQYADEGLIPLEEYVGDGGGLLLVPEQISVASGHTAGQGFEAIAATLEHFGFSSRGPRISREPLNLTQLQEGHPIFASLADLPASAFASVHVRRWVALGGEINVLMAAASPEGGPDDQVPVLVERSLGSGTVLCLSSCLEAGCSDLAVSPLLVPLFDAVGKYLSVRSRRVEPAALQPEKPESDLTRLSDEDQRALAGQMDVRFLSGSALPSGIPSHALGGSLTGFLLILALLCALVELWLSNVAL